MPFVNLEPAVVASIKLFLAENGLDGPIRLELQSSGCCDPSLGLCVDRVRQDDLLHETDGLTFVISPATHERVGQISISFKDDILNRVYVVTSEKPLNEWAGFGVSQIRISPELMYR